MTKTSLPGVSAAASLAFATAATAGAASRPACCRQMPRIAFATLPRAAAARTTAGASPRNNSSRSYHALTTRTGVLPQHQRPLAFGGAQQAQQASWSLGGRQSRRSIFIQTENTPNADALKFLPNHAVLPATMSVPFVEYLSPRTTIAPPYPSPLAAQLMNVDGVTAVFYGRDFITVTKAPDAQWVHIRPEVFSLITEAIASGQPMVKVQETGAEGTGNKAADGTVTAEASGVGADASADATSTTDSLEYDENDSEVVGMIKELLETRIRPAIQEDGGDIEFRGFENGQVLLKLRGACRTCDSSTVTLKSGIESMLMHYIEEVQGVTQVLDQEEEVALREFAKFEEQLKKRAVPPSPTDNGTMGTVAG